ncbi:hypothetical protein HZB01_01365 [Candidatus Woesearchaeota archaeon]|nr:hypothetical protein [Candidatus Woesearchaeota archaeon]
MTRQCWICGQKGVRERNLNDARAMLEQESLPLREQYLLTIFLNGLLGLQITINYDTVNIILAKPTIFEDCLAALKEGTEDFLKDIGLAFNVVVHPYSQEMMSRISIEKRVGVDGTYEEVGVGVLRFWKPPPVSGTFSILKELKRSTKNAEDRYRLRQQFPPGYLCFVTDADCKKKIGYRRSVDRRHSRFARADFL